PAELTQRVDGPSGGTHQRALGELELEQLRPQAGLVQDSRDVVDDALVVRLPHGQIDADQELGVWVGVVPGGGLLAGLLEHSTAARDDAAGLLGESDEVVRCQPAEGGMPPAYERLD